MTTFKKILLLFLGLFMASFMAFGGMAILNHDTFQSVVIHTLEATGICLLIYPVGMLMMWVAYRVANLIPKKSKNDMSRK